MPLVITESLARIVLPLSTKVLSDSLVSLSAAFFEWWRIHYHATLFVPQSSVCLASSSVPLRTYVFNPNNHIILAGIREPNSHSCQVLSTFHVALEQTFAFYECIDRDRTCNLHCLKMLLNRWATMRNLPRSAAPVAPYLVRYRIQHSSCLSPCEILNLASSLPSSVQLLQCLTAFSREWSD